MRPSGSRAKTSIWPSRELRGGPEETWLSAHAGGTRVTVQSNSLPTIASAAAAGLGLAVLPTALGDGDSRLTRLWALVAIAPRTVRLWALVAIAPRTVWLLYRRDARATARTRAVASAVEGDLRERLARASGGAAARPARAPEGATAKPARASGGGATKPARASGGGATKPARASRGE